MLNRMAGERVFILLNVINSILAAEWGYSGSNGPANWKNSFQDCGGSKQSPIDIDNSNVEYKNIAPFRFSGYDQKPTGMTLVNNGHTAQVNVEGSMQISGAELEGTYKTAQFHFHWGSTNIKGSEHTLDGLAYPMEIHFVHYSTKYSDLGSAADKAKGLAVLGFMFEIDDDDNAALNTLIEGLSQIGNKDATSTLDPFTLNSILPETSNLNDFYRYDGSLTTPGCFESVIWSVFRSPIKISQTQLNKFRELNGAEGKIVDNFRPVQPINDRSVYTNFKTSSAGQLHFNLIFIAFASFFGSCLH